MAVVRAALGDQTVARQRPWSQGAATEINKKRYFKMSFIDKGVSVYIYIYSYRRAKGMDR